MSKLIQVERQNKIFEVIFERETRRILEYTMNMPRSSHQIILGCNIAQSTAYRKLRKLVKLNLLHIMFVMGEYGRWERKYQSNLCLINRKHCNSNHSGIISKI